MAHFFHTITYCNTCKSLATVESTITNCCHAVGNCYTRKPFAIIEGIISNACHAVGNNKTCYQFSVNIQVFCIIKRVRFSIYKTNRTPLCNICNAYFRKFCTIIVSKYKIIFPRLFRLMSMSVSFDGSFPPVCLLSITPKL